MTFFVVGRQVWTLLGLRLFRVVLSRCSASFGELIVWCVPFRGVVGQAMGSESV